MARNYTFALGEYYHIYNRGVDKRKTFLNRRDYERFQFLLYICNNPKRIHVRDYRGLTSEEIYNLKREGALVDIGGYCIMPNHFHLLVKEKEEGGISKFIQKVTTGYTMYFNQVNERKGALFQGSFKAEHVDNDRYLKYLYSYIALNPLKITNKDWKNKISEKHESFLNLYKHSSFADLKGEIRPENAILNSSVFPAYFSKPIEFSNFIKEWISVKNEYIQNSAESNVPRITEVKPR